MRRFYQHTIFCEPVVNRNKFPIPIPVWKNRNLKKTSGLTCTARGSTWWGSAAGPPLFWPWSRWLWGDTVDTFISLGQTVRGPGLWLFKVKPIIFNLRETPKLCNGLLPEATLGFDETDLAHLQLEEPPLLLHLLSDFCPTDFRTDHPVLPRVLLLLLLYLGADGTCHHTG